MEILLIVAAVFVVILGILWALLPFIVYGIAQDAAKAVKELRDIRRNQEKCMHSDGIV
jgi:hypothetical protein